MQLPDFGHMTVGEIAGYLIPLAFLVLLVGLIKAATSATVLWTYLKDWITSWLGPALILLALALVGQGVSPWIQPNLAVQLIFIPAVVTFVAAALASIAKNLGLDLSRLPLSKNVYAAFDEEQIKAIEPATPTGNGPATPSNT